MTQTQLDNYITQFRCCSGELANEIANSLFIGGCDRTKDLVLLLGYITALTHYNLEAEENCITEEELNQLVAKAKRICNDCGCNN
jgi:hypothetical protein